MKRKTYDEDQRRYNSDPPPGYVQSRGALREKFGPRQIDASAPPSDRNRNLIATGGEFGTGKTQDQSWDAFFKPVTPETSMFGAAAPAPTRTFKDLGVSGGDRASTFASMAPTPAVPSAASPSLPTQPIDYLKAAHQKSTQFWNGQGQSIPAPIAGAVQAGTSFKNRFGTGRVDSARPRSKYQSLFAGLYDV